MRRSTHWMAMFAAAALAAAPGVGQAQQRDDAQPRNQERLNQRDPEGQQQRDDDPRLGREQDRYRRSGRAADAKEQFAQSDRLKRASFIVDADVENLQGEDLGDIQDVVVSPRRGKALYAVIDTGVIGKHVAVPLSAIQWDREDEKFKIDVSKDQLEDAPDIDMTADRLPLRPSFQWMGAAAQGQARGVQQEEAREADQRQTLHERLTEEREARRDQGRRQQAQRDDQDQPQRRDDVVGRRPTASNRNLVLLSDMLDMRADTIFDERLGDVEDIVLDTQDGDLLYVIVASGGFLGLGENLRAVPFAAVNYDRQRDRLSVAIDRARYQNAPSFSGDDWPDIADVQWAQRTHEAFDLDPQATVYGYGIYAKGQQQQGEGRQFQPQSDRQQQGRSGSRAFQQLAQGYNADQEQTISGAVQRAYVGTAGGVSQALIVVVQTDDDARQQVCAGPAHVYQQKGVEFNPGDKVRLTVAPIQTDTDTVWLARSATVDGQTIEVLRERQGRFMPAFAEPQGPAPGQSQRSTPSREQQEGRDR